MSTISALNRAQLQSVSALSGSARSANVAPPPPQVKGDTVSISAQAMQMYSTWASSSVAGADTGILTVTAAQAVLLFKATPGAAAVQIKDSGAGISKNLDALQQLGTKISSITQSDPANPLVVSKAQMTSAADTLGKLQSAYTLSVTGVTAADASSVLSDSRVANIVVADSSTNISAALGDLQALGTKLKAVTQTGVKAPIGVNVAQIAQYASTLAKVDGGKYTLNVGDSQDNITSALTTLKGLGAKLGSITRTSGSAAFEFSAAQVANFAGVLAKVDGGQYQVNVTDTSANVLKGLSSLQGLGANLGQVVLTDPGATLAVNAKQVAAGVGALGKIESDFSLAVTDSSASIAKSIDGLQAVTSHISSITQSGTKVAMAMTAAQRTAASATLAKIDGGNYSLALTNVQRGDLADISGDSHVKAMSVNITDGDISGLSDSRITSIAVSGASLMQAVTAGSDSRVKSIAVSDAGANFTGANVNALYAVAKAKPTLIGKIEANDATRQTLSMKVADYQTYTPAFVSKFSNMALQVDFSGAAIKGTSVVKDSMDWYKTVANPSGTFSIKQWNGTGQWVDFATLRAGTNFIKFSDKTTFLDTGNKSLNALLNVGTTDWQMNPGGSGATTSSTQIAPGVYALDSSSVRTTIKYSFYTDASQTAVSDPATSFKNSYGFSQMTDAQKAGVGQALNYYSSLINVKFEFTSDVTQADIKFGTNNQGTTSGGYATGGNSASGGVGLFLNNAGASGQVNADMTPGGYGWTTLVHEIGHTLGLKHPGAYNAGGGTTPGPYLTGTDDSKRNTVMSYKDPADAFNWKDLGGGQYAGGSANPSTLMKLDILALQFLYGRNTSGVSSTDGASTLSNFETTSFNNSWLGMETVQTGSSGTSLDLSAVSASNIVDLRAGAFSSINVKDTSFNSGIGGTQKQTFFNLNNVALAYGATVNTVTGGSSTDVVYTTRRNATIDGGAGTDKLMLYGSVTDWSVAIDSDSGEQAYTNKKDLTTIVARNIEAVGYYNDTTLSLLHSRVNLVV